MHMVYCKRLNKEAKGLDSPPFPGSLGREIFSSVSEDAFAEWKEMQIKIINEYRLDLAEAQDRQTLLKQMRAFLGLPEQGDAPDMLQVGDPKNVREP